METTDDYMIFGPVPSRRLGNSMGINVMPSKVCSYSCVYCQVGRTLHLTNQRRRFCDPAVLFEKIKGKTVSCRNSGTRIDYITFVSDGEPTLDLNLGEEIDLVKQLGYKIAVITNSSLLWREDVRGELNRADLVSVKVDAVSDEIRNKINRPRDGGKTADILSGIKEFVSGYRGNILTETMLVRDLNTITEEVERIADFISTLKPLKSYVSIPTRPPAEDWVLPANPYSLAVSYQFFKDRRIDVEYLIEYEGNAFSFTGNVENDILSITSVHPMRRDAVDEYLIKAKADWSEVEKLLEKGKISEVTFNGHKFYVRKF